MSQQENINWNLPRHSVECWGWDFMNGWHNAEDDPPTPTEEALLFEIMRLLGENQNLKHHLENLRSYSDTLEQGLRKAVVEKQQQSSGDGGA